MGFAVYISTIHLFTFLARLAMGPALAAPGANFIQHCSMNFQRCDSVNPHVTNTSRLSVSRSSRLVNAFRRNSRACRIPAAKSTVLSVSATGFTVAKRTAGEALRRLRVVTFRRYAALWRLLSAALRTSIVRFLFQWRLRLAAFAFSLMRLRPGSGKQKRRKTSSAVCGSGSIARKNVGS
jgi:hypothetical protein